MPKIPSEVLQYIEDAKKADFYGALDYVAKTPYAQKMLNLLFKEPIVKGLDYDVLINATIDVPEKNKKKHRETLNQIHKTLDDMIALKIAQKVQDQPNFAITLAGHDTCVTYANLLAAAKKSEDVKTDKDAINKVKEFLATTH